MTCADCKFVAKIGMLGPQPRLECRRFPPTPILMKVASGNSTVGSFFPTTKPELGCGEYQSKLTAS